MVIRMIDVAGEMVRMMVLIVVGMVVKTVVVA